MEKDYIMKKFSASAEINASPEALWSILTDGERYPEWDPGMERLEGKVAAGEKITAHTKLSPRAFPVTVSVFEPNRKMVWSSGMPLGLFKGARTTTLTPMDDGKTSVTVEEVFSGLLSPLIGRTIPDLQPSFDNFVEGLKQRAESA
jgi:hypothetical protein